METIEEAEKLIREMLDAAEDDHGVGCCDCRPEPENQGHCCCWCKARAKLDGIDQAHEKITPET